MAGSGMRDDPWQLTTAPGTSASQVWWDDADPPLLVCRVRGTRLTLEARRDRIRAI